MKQSPFFIDTFKISEMQRKNICLSSFVLQISAHMSTQTEVTYLVCNICIQCNIQDVDPLHMGANSDLMRCDIIVNYIINIPG